MRISFYAYDLGPSKNLAMIANEAVQRAHRVAFVGNDELRGKNLFYLQPDVLVTSISSFQSKDELDLGKKAGELGIPWIVVADTHYVCVRPAAKGKINNAIALVVSPHEINKAKEFGYQRAEYLGGPPIWQEFPFIKPAKIKRKKDEKIIFVGGIKDARLTDGMLVDVVKAMDKLEVKWKLIFNPHPNEWKETQDLNRRNNILEKVQLIKTPARTDNLLGSVDVSVHTGGATATITAAYLRLPVIYYENEEIRTRQVKQIGVEGWFPADSGACAKANPENLAKVTARLLTKEGVAELCKRQEEVYPLPESGGKRVEERIMDFME